MKNRYTYPKVGSFLKKKYDEEYTLYFTWVISTILVASNITYTPDSLIDSKSQIWGLISKSIHTLDILICIPPSKSNSTQ